MRPSSSILERLLIDISQNDKLRVWSMIITVFGDAIVPRGGTIGLSSLQEIMGGLKIEQNAVRTAMSRLARDGWVKRDRIGRQSYYRLARDGYDLFEKASRRIYCVGESEWSGLFEVVLRPEDDHKNRAQFQKQMWQLGFGSPMQDVYVRPEVDGAEALPDDVGSIVMEAGKLANMPLDAFIRKCWPVDDLSSQYQRLVMLFSPVLDGLENDLISNPLECLVLRALLIHEWRKLVLKNVDLPDEYRPDDDAAIRARILVGKVYRRLLGPSETYLDGCYCKPGTCLPPASATVSARFKD